MGGKEDGWGGWPPAPSVSPPNLQKDDDWTHYDNSVNAVSFGFVATAILISMFLVMAIFEKFLRTTTPGVTAAGGRRLQSDIEAHNRAGGFNAKLGYPSPKMSLNAKEVSVLMPGDTVPKYIAPSRPPGPCPPERIPWPSHQQLTNIHNHPEQT